MKAAAFAFIDGNREAMLGFWRELVDTESGTTHKAGVDALAARIGQVIEAAGGKARILPMARAGNMLVGEFGLERARPAIAFLGHMDTVFPLGTVAERPFTLSEGKAWGPGVLDMKGGIVAMVFAIRALEAAGYRGRPLKLILAGDEENAHAGSDAAARLVAEARGCAAAFNGETGFLDDGIVIGRKGTAVFTLEVKGVAVHAGNEPENGRSAILELAHKVIAIQALNGWKQGITFNVGVIQGGTVVNAVPDRARAMVDVRYLDPLQLPDIQAELEAVAGRTHVAGTSTALTQEPGISPMQTTEGCQRLFAVVERCCGENGWPAPHRKFVGGGSDSAYSVIAGVPTVCAMGVQGGRNHSAQEFAEVESLFRRAKLLAACVLDLDLDQHFPD
jgi:glutamate carboxypeptidase